MSETLEWICLLALFVINSLRIVLGKGGAYKVKNRESRIMNRES